MDSNLATEIARRYASQAAKLLNVGSFAPAAAAATNAYHYAVWAQSLSLGETKA